MNGAEGLMGSLGRDWISILEFTAEEEIGKYRDSPPQGTMES